MDGETNFLSDLQTLIFEQMKEVTGKMNSGENLDEVIKRAMSFNELAKTAMANGALMAKVADALYGIPISDKVPLLPKINEDTFLVDGKRKSLLAMPKNNMRDEEEYGFTKGRGEKYK